MPTWLERVCSPEVLPKNRGGSSIASSIVICVSAEFKGLPGKLGKSYLSPITFSPHVCLDKNCIFLVLNRTLQRKHLYFSHQNNTGFFQYYPKYQVFGGTTKSNYLNNVWV